MLHTPTVSTDFNHLPLLPLLLLLLPSFFLQPGDRNDISLNYDDGRTDEKGKEGREGRGRREEWWDKRKERLPLFYYHVAYLDSCALVVGIIRGGKGKRSRQRKLFLPYGHACPYAQLC